MSLRPKKRRYKANHVGAPKIFQLELCCQQLNRAFDGHCYLVGSSNERADWRDIDIRLMLDDDAFDRLFPNARGKDSLHEHDLRWLIMTTSISEWLSRVTGLPVDFQFQRQTQANKQHPGMRQAIGMVFSRE